MIEYLVFDELKCEARFSNFKSKMLLTPVLDGFAEKKEQKQCTVRERDAPDIEQNISHSCSRHTDRVTHQLE